MECPRCGLVQGDAPRCVGCGARVAAAGPAGAERPAATERKLPAAGFASVGLTDRRKALLFQQLARLVRAGIAPVEALETIAGGAAGRRMEAVCRTIIGVLRDGGALADAMAGLPRDFSAHEVGAVRAAELVGEVPEALDELREQLERGRARVREVLGGLVYPLVVLGLSFFLLPLPHLFFGRVDAWLREALTPLVVLAALLTAAVWLRGRLRRHPRYAPPLRAAAARTPIVGSLLRRSARRTFAAHLGRALEAGVPVDRALRSAGGATGDPRFEALAAAAEAEVDRGRSLTDALRTSGLFPADALLLVAGGERSGDLGGSLATVARHEEEDLDQRAHVVTRLLTIGLSLVILGYVGLRVFAGMSAALSTGHDALMEELPPGLFQEIPHDALQRPGGIQELLDEADDALRGPAVRPMPE